MIVRADPIAYPPRGMSRDEAARYVGVGSTLFDQMVGDGRMPRPTRIGKRVIFDRLRIDAAFADLADRDTRENAIDRALRLVPPGR